MNSRKKIAELERRLALAQGIIDEYYEKITEYEIAQRAIPEGCTPGRWCEACALADVISVQVYDRGFSGPFSACRYVDLRICGRNKCGNFIQKQREGKSDD